MHLRFSFQGIVHEEYSVYSVPLAGGVGIKVINKEIYFTCSPHKFLVQITGPVKDKVVPDAYLSTTP
jgi:hypothetical protein